jgi:hypothetical protein
MNKGQKYHIHRQFIGVCWNELGAKRRIDKEVPTMAYVYYQQQAEAPKVEAPKADSPQDAARREAARQAAEASREAARQVATFLEVAREASRQAHTYHASLDKSGGLWLHIRDSDNKMIGQPLMIANVWKALTERSIELQPQGSEVRFTIGDQLVVRVNMKLQARFLRSPTLQLLPSLEVEWKSQEAARELTRQLARWDHSSELDESGYLTVDYYDGNDERIHQVAINIIDVLDQIGLALKPRKRAVVSFLIGEDLIEATVELEVEFLWFRRKLKLVSVTRKPGEGWRLSIPWEKSKIISVTDVQTGSSGTYWWDY